MASAIAAPAKAAFLKDLCMGISKIDCPKHDERKKPVRPHDPSLTRRFEYGPASVGGNRGSARAPRYRPARAENVAERRQADFSLRRKPVHRAASRLAPGAIVPYLFA